MKYKTLRFLFSFHGTVYKYGDTIEVEDAKSLEIPIREGCVECIEDVILKKAVKAVDVPQPQKAVARTPVKKMNRGVRNPNGNNNKL